MNRTRNRPGWSPTGSCHILQKGYHTTPILKESKLVPICVQTIYTHKLKESVKFYTEGLGYEIEEAFGESIVQLKTNGIPLIIEQIAEEEPERASFAFRSQSLEPDIERLRQSGARILQSVPQRCPVGRYVTFMGPDNVKHELIEFTDKG